MINRMGQLWTAEEYETLKVAFNAGASLVELCESHGRTPYAIIGKLTAMNILVAVGRNYHRVDPDPWALGLEVRDLQYPRVST